MIHPKNHHKCFARLACVKHAASVHPEPGSNSLKKFVQDQNLAWLIFYPVLFTLVLFFKNYILLNFQGYVTVQLSRFFVFRCSSATFTSYHVRFSLSRTFLTFFQKFFWSSFVTHSASIDFITVFRCCQQLFSTFWIFYFFLFIQKKYGEGGIWTLAPRERSTPLAGAPLQPLEYFSKFKCIQFWTAFISDAFEIILYEFTFVNAFFNFFQLFILYHRNALFFRSFFNRIVKAITQIITESREPAAVASPMG